MWFDLKRVLTYNTLFNFIIGNRGSGKTFSFKKWAVDDFLNNGNQFIYLRRYKTELKGLHFFDQISGEYPNVKFEDKGSNLFINKKLAGYALPLSTAITIKSKSFEDVNKMCFDEFMIEEGNYRYLPNEVQAFLDFYETCNRLRMDGRKDITVFFLSNAISLYNPYFTYFNIKFQKGKNTFRKGDLYAEVYLNEEYVKEKQKSRFGRLIAGTEYEEYAVLNSFYLDDDKLIFKKTAESYCWSVFTIDGKDYGVWVDYKIGKMFISTDVDPYCNRRYCFSGTDHSVNTMLIKGHSPVIKMFSDNYKMGNVYFESMEVKKSTWDMVNRIIY